MPGIHNVYSTIEELAAVPAVPASDLAFMRKHYESLGMLYQGPYPLSAKAAAIKAAIDESALLVMETFKLNGLQASGSDPIERVVEALAVYAVQSGNALND